MHAAVELRKITKTFGGQRALDDMSVRFEPGRVTALLGQNGSGKSTLIKILSGFYTPDPGNGEILINGSPIRIPVHPRDVHRRGVRFLHQDLAIVPDMTVSDNFALTERFTGVVRAGLIRQRAQDARVATVLERLGVGVKPTALMGDLTPAERTMVAIARAFFEAGRPTIFLDEPTASLPESEVVKVFSALRRAVAEGGSIVYVSHRLDEVQRIADDLVIFRDGRLVSTVQGQKKSTSEIVELILGRPAPTKVRSGRSEERPAVLQVAGLTGPRLRSVDFTLGRGEILGVSGLTGCGRSELTRMMAGDQIPASGSMQLLGTAYAPRSPRQSRLRGVGYVPQDRRREGIVDGMSISDNATLSVLRTLTRAGMIRRDRERSLADELIGRFRVVPAVAAKPVGELSGGNQQKVVFARNSALDLKVLVLDEPTQGIDIGARAEIANVCRELAASGISILVASTDFEELALLCDRVLVLDRGEIVDDIVGDEISVERITASSFSPPKPLNRGESA